VSFFESVVRDHSKDHPMTVAHISNDTLTGIRTPLWRTPLPGVRTPGPTVRLNGCGSGGRWLLATKCTPLPEVANVNQISTWAINAHRRYWGCA
jgi:hypothetical protein